MLDLLKSLVDGLRAGAITPGTFLGLIFLGIVAWIATKGGEKALKSVSGLLAEGEKMRLTLSSQLDAAHARSAMLEQARDHAIAAVADAEAKAARLAERVESLSLRLQDLEDDLMRATSELSRARLQLARLPPPGA